MRRILLTLAENVTETHCGSCPHIGEPHGDWCSVWGALPLWRKRIPECLTAEAAAARMVEIAPEDVANVRFDLWAPSGEDEDHKAVERVENALRAHAAKADASETPDFASYAASALRVGYAVLAALPDTSARTILAYRWRIAEAVRDVIAAKDEVKR